METSNVGMEMGEREVKPLVFYTELCGEVRVGTPALLIPFNHPSPFVSNNGMVRTSPVVFYAEKAGIIETQNTIYQRKE